MANVAGMRQAWLIRNSSIVGDANYRCVLVCGIRGAGVCKLFISSLAEQGLHVEQHEISNELLSECRNGCDDICNIQNYTGGMVLFVIHW